METRQAGTAATRTSLTIRCAVPPLVVPAAFLAALVVTSCGSPGPATSAGGTPAPAQPASTGTTQEAVISAYEALWPAGQQAEQAPPDQRNALLSPHATGAELSSMLNGFAADDAAGQRSWGHPVVHPYAVEVSEGTATLQDCQDDTSFGTMSTTSGKQLTYGVPRLHLTAVLDRGADGAWRVASIRQVPQQCLPITLRSL
jgi:hypothetical protein